MLNNRFDLDVPGAAGTIGSEVSPFGQNLNVSYPKADPDGLVEGMQEGSTASAAAGPKAWVDVLPDVRPFVPHAGSNAIAVSEADRPHNGGGASLCTWNLMFRTTPSALAG